MRDRRRAYRARVQASVLVSVDAARVRGDLVDLSLRGARIATPAPLPARVGASCVVTLGLARWVQVRGTVRRVDAAGVAIEHARLDDRAEEAIDAAIVAAVEAERARLVVVAGRDAARRERIAMAIAKRGGDPLEVASPLEAIAAVEAASRVHAVAIADDLGELAGYLSESHPELRIARLDADADVATAVRDLFA